MNQQEINQQFKQVNEVNEEENESESKPDKLSDEEIQIPNPNVDGKMRNTVSGAFYDSKKQNVKKQSVVKNYGDITN